MYTLGQKPCSQSELVMFMHGFVPIKTRLLIAYHTAFYTITIKWLNMKISFRPLVKSV